ncbi:MAG: YdcF family protein [Xanthobacteraceae bacterium]
MTYYISKLFWLLAAPTNALVLISASAGLWAVLGNSSCAAWLAAAAACGLVIGAFTPIGLALTVPLENRFPFSRLDPQVRWDGIIILPGGADGIDALSKLSQDYPKARLTLCGFRAGENLIKRFTDLGVDPSRILIESQSRTTSEDALYSAALLKPKPSERWLLVTAAMHMPRAVGCFRVAGFQAEPYPVEFMTRGRSGPFALFATGSSALIQLNRTAKEWVGLIAYRLMGKTDAMFPRPQESKAVTET